MPGIGLNNYKQVFKPIPAWESTLPDAFQHWHSTQDAIEETQQYEI